MPPQGLLVLAAALPPTWQVRFVDENVAPAGSADFAWADAVFVSGMHVQRRWIADICGRAHAAGKPAVLGGPSVSASPELYPDFDYLHIGEIGGCHDRAVRHPGARLLAPTPADAAHDARAPSARPLPDPRL